METKETETNHFKATKSKWGPRGGQEYMYKGRKGSVLEAGIRSLKLLSQNVLSIWHRKSDTQKGYEKIYPLTFLSDIK